MAKTNTPPQVALYKALADGALSEKQLRSKSKVSDEEYDEVMYDWRSRALIEVLDPGDDAKIALTNVGRNEIRNTFPVD
jgi:hypothetical protein